MTKKDKLKEAEEVTNTNPTEGQKRGGNYKKGKVTLKGLKITIENPVGSIRSGVDSEGDEWESEMLYTYGYFNGTIGKDGDPIDVFIGPEIEEEFDVYIIDQVEEESKAFDEHKVMFGFEDAESAKSAYLSCYEKNWKGFSNIVTISLSKFKKWIKNKDAIKYPAKRLNMSSRLDFKNKGDDNIQILRLFGEVIEGESLRNLKDQAGDITNLKQVILEIASPGGSVSEGLEIMVWLDSLSQQGIEVVTIVVANAYSIASLIMLAADIKLISTHGKVMVHNPMVPELQYVNANDLEEYIDSLRGLEQMMYDLYETFTKIKKEQIKLLMDNETYLSPQEAVDYGFADLVVDIKPKSYEMATNIKREVNMSKTLNMINKVIALVNQADFINQLYYDSEGGEIEIFQNDPSTYKIGDRTSIETSGEDGIKLSDGSKLIIEDFTITNIIKSTEEEVKEAPGGDEAAEFNEGPAPSTEEVVEEAVVEEPAVKKPVEDVPVKSKDEMPGKVIETTESTKTTKETVATQVRQVSKWESNVINATFELGEQVQYEPYEEGGEPYSVGAGEFELEDGSTVLTDAEGIIRWKSPAPAEALETASEAKKELESEAKASEEEIAKVKEEAEAKVEEAEAKVKEAEAKATDIENKFKALEEKVEAKFAHATKFENATAMAIDTIAENTVSHFKPEARSKAALTQTGSIFSRAKKAVGLD